MRIKRIIIENFGPHSSLEWGIEAGVVGILGPNGSGKSHVLLALEFALTGDLPGNRKTYIRQGTKKGFVEVWFEQNHVEGRVKRHLDSTKRELDWDGKTYSKAAEVDEMFGQILGARKESFKNTSFIRQGELKAVLDGTETQRRNVLIKLLSLGYVERRRTQLDQKIDLYAQNNLDESVYGRRDQLREQNAELNETVKTMGEALDKMAFYEPDITAVQEYLEKHKALTEERQNLATVRHQVDTGFNPGEIQEYELGVKKIASTEKKLTQASQKARELADRKLNLTRLAGLRKDIENSEQELKTARKELEALRAEFKTLTGSDDIENARDILTKKENEVSYVRSLLEVERAIKRRSEAYNEAQSTLQEFPEEKLKEMEVNHSELSERVAAADVRAYISKNSLAALKAAAEKSGECNGDKVTCPKCSLKVIPCELLTEASLKAAEDEAKETAETAETARQELLKKGNELDAYEKARERAVADCETHQKELTSLRDDQRRLKTDVIGESDIETLEATLEKLRSSIAQIARETTKTQIAEGAINRKQQAVEALDLPENADPGKTDEELEAANTKVSEYESELETLRTRRDAYADTYKAYEQAKERRRYLSRDRIPALEQAVSAFKPSDNVAKLLKELNTKEFQVVYDTMVEAHQERLAKQNELHTHRKALAENQQQLIAVEVAVSKQEHHKHILDKMRELRRLLEADGVLKAYLSYRFRRLHNTVSKNLNLLDANFVIRPCPGALSYEFHRSGEDTGWMGISKLSGGQKVKLSTAFLISVQETICQDVNFLVLDEPSTHLDESSVDALSSLLADLATRMDDGNGQIWIVDHHFNLQGACSSGFRLGSEQPETV